MKYNIPLPYLNYITNSNSAKHIPYPRAERDDGTS